MIKHRLNSKQDLHTALTSGWGAGGENRQEPDWLGETQGNG